MRSSQLSGLAILALALAITTHAQVSFVASIKANNSVDARGLSEFGPGGRFTATAITVRNLIRNAYRTQDYQLAGAPAWFSTKRYDIEAKADDTPPPSQQALLRALLADRFKLAVHNETREMPTFSLVLAKAGGKPGSQLTKSDFDCAAYAASSHPLPGGVGTPPCAANSRTGAFSGKAIPLSQLAVSLAFFTGRPTVDKTGLAGRYDVELTWASDPDAPSIFTALQEQLGLKLISDKGPVEVLVVDRAEEPSAN
jgi:uncharacterized protein (TIGR03435 family)